MKIHTRNLLMGSAAAFMLTAYSGAYANQALPQDVPAPAHNPTTAAKVGLGKQLYFDPRLSIDGTVSCNSCHNVMSSGTDNRPTSVGVDGQRGGRNAPTVWNAAFMTAQFWDGRAATLEDQAKGPPLNPIEMGMPSAEAVEERLQQIPGYVQQFEAVFGGQDAVSYDNMARAIAAFERTLVTRNSPFDRYVKGDKQALSAQAQRGMKLFQQTGCNACHSGANFAGPLSLPMGEGFYQMFPSFDSEYTEKYQLKQDKGRFEATGDEADMHMWKVPTLRNVALTAPYFHNGSVQTLDEAVRVMAKTQLDRALNDQEVADMVAFLNSLTGEFPDITLPRLPDTPNSSIVGAVK
ncbi:cytochrome C peroxidase [Candidatus Tenderia electrophaga]|jgi:cytochrome c peroxidase|uniref:Cytochrome C peroxidase n=1 Tax=Candidatus Tenderia electrophaga TaxID=1748243 RepID=A0A0S2TAI7_9GAMM|nr:cytochrome C peroxidase [Candidatus Tenderia electrophaga]